MFQINSIYLYILLCLFFPFSGNGTEITESKVLFFDHIKSNFEIPAELNSQLYKQLILSTNGLSDIHIFIGKEVGHKFNRADREYSIYSLRVEVEKSGKDKYIVMATLFNDTKQKVESEIKSKITPLSQLQVRVNQALRYVLKTLAAP